MLYKRIIPFCIISIISANFLFAKNKTPQIDSIQIALNSVKNDTVVLNNLVKRLNAKELRSFNETDSLALIILERFNALKYNDGVNRTIDLLATLNYKRGNFKIALKYHKELLSRLQKGNTNSNQVASVYKFLTGDYLNLGSFDSAIFYGERAVIEFKNLNDSQNLSRTLNLLGGIYWNKGNLKKGSEKLFESLKIRQALKDTLGVANAYNNIGLIFDSQGKLTDALEMYHKALDLYNILNDTRGIGQACNNIAIVLKNQGRLSESLEMFMKSLEVDKKLNNIDDQGKTLNNIGLLYLELSDIQNGVNFFFQSLDALTQSGNENGIAAVYINLGRAYFVQKNYQKSEFYYIKSLELSAKISSNEWIRDSYEGLYRISKELGRNKEALMFHEKFKNLNDSLRSLENLNKLDQLKIEFETDQKEKEIALLSKDNELSSLKLKKQESVTHLLLTIIISSLIIIFLILLYVHRLKADKKLLIQKNAEITQQKEEILAQRDMLEASNIELNQQKEELLTQSEQIEIQHQLISGINRRMTEGLEYASLIQQTLLPSSSVFSKHFSDQFILFKPKDIVSGDLYWTWEENDEIIFAIADCTGHGVAGAFMSVMAISLLKDAVSVNKLNRPEQIANYLYNEFIKSSNLELNSIVGIDFIISKYSAKEKKLIYCGNHMNFIRLKDGEIELYKIGRMFNVNSNQYKFQESSISLEEDVKLYFYTDGYTDQLSGVKRKKMGRNELQKLIVSIEQQPMYLQSETIDAFYNKWKGNFEQVDDVLVIGLKV